jgi:isoleucyl-tRNA synthetase
MVRNNRQINWTPTHIRDGRFGNWLEGARDWAISRNRFWGAPLPVWVTDDGERVVIGSIAELKEKAVNPEAIGDLHRPYIDDVEIRTESGKIARRIPEIFDVWFESGSMPYAQEHYPFEHKDSWEQKFPANFIAEAIDQTRGWFYTLHVLATALFDKPAFMNVICSGWVVAADGEKLSKRKKNYAPMVEVFDQFGVDTMRYFMASSPIVNGEDVRFSTDYLRDVQRKVFMTLNNIYSFYKLYADVDGWQPQQPLLEPASTNLLDKWMLSRLNETITEVTNAMEEYRLDKATRPLDDLLDDASNWFVRRSRRRFWKSEDDQDKHQAYATLHYTLLRLCQLLAPFSPFLPDYLWGKLTAGTELPSSVHLSDWPSAGAVNRALLNQMAQARDYITTGLAQRAESKVKVRQPLAAVTVPELPNEYADIIAEELNVKRVTWSTAGSVKVDTAVTDDLKVEGIMRDLIRHIQNARKQADLQVDDRIELAVQSDGELVTQSLKQHAKTISQETLAVKLNETIPTAFDTTVRVEGETVRIALSKTEV